MAKREKKSAVADDAVVSVKGFNRNLTCREHKFEVGKTYSVDGAIKACKNGFHACPEHPLDVFEFYPPASSIYHEVKQGGERDDSHRPQKLASATITIGVSLSLSDLVTRAVKYVLDRAKPSKGTTTDEDYGAASSTGDYGAASSTGVRGAASSTGDYGAASSTGARGAVAMATGFGGKAMGVEGGAIALVCRNKDTGEILACRMTKVGENGVKPNVYYRLNADGEFMEAE